MSDEVLSVECWAKSECRLIVQIQKIFYVKSLLNLLIRLRFLYNITCSVTLNIRFTFKNILSYNTTSTGQNYYVYIPID